jgi:hypothetical protein
MLDPVTKWAREKGKRWSQRHPPKLMLDLDWDQIISAQAGEARAARRAQAGAGRGWAAANALRHRVPARAMCNSSGKALEEKSLDEL